MTTPVKPAAGVKVMFPVDGSTIAVPSPDDGGIVTVTLDGTSAPPGLPAASLASVWSVTGEPCCVVARSVLATGGFGLIRSSTVMVSSSVGQDGTVVPTTQTGTLYTYTPGRLPVKT